MIALYTPDGFHVTTGDAACIVVSHPRRGTALTVADRDTGELFGPGWAVEVLRRPAVELALADAVRAAEWGVPEAAPAAAGSLDELPF